jgi:hypothetical protein
MASMSAITIHAPNPEVMIINLPGYEVDTHVKVFNREIHVHSIILKLNSRFFRTFMDSADKTPAPASARFKYEYDAVADSDGKTWGLEAVAKVSYFHLLLSIVAQAVSPFNWMISPLLNSTVLLAFIKRVKVQNWAPEAC